MLKILRSPFDYYEIFNYYQTMFVAIILVLLVFYAVFAWLTFRRFHLTFRPHKRDNEIVPSGGY